MYTLLALFGTALLGLFANCFYTRPEVNTIKSMLYIGSNLDIVPVLFFKGITHFVFIDSLPFSEYGNLSITESINKIVLKRVGLNEIDNYPPHDPSFLSRLEITMNQNGFVSVERNTEESYILYRSNDRTVKYYYNRAFPDFITYNLIRDISKCSILYVCGHNPDDIVLDMMMKPVTFVGFSKSSYSQEYPLFQRLLKSTADEVNKYYLLRQQEEGDELDVGNYNLIKCDDIRDLASKTNSYTQKQD